MAKTKTQRPKTAKSSKGAKADRYNPEKNNRNDRQQRRPRRERAEEAPAAVLPEGLIAGRNAVFEALRSGRAIDRLFVQDNAEGSIGKILNEAKERGLVLTRVSRAALDRMAQGAVHQGVVAQAAAHTYAEVEDILRLAQERGEDPLLVLLDGLEDPHNLGAIMRSAECAGAHGIIIPKHASVGLTETVAKASAGAIEYMPVARVTNLVRTMEELKEKGVWIAACDMGDSLYYEADLKGPLAIVVGNEGKGISRLVKEHCDLTVSIPLRGKINSLNASNAAAVILYEARRQRDLAAAE